MYDGERVSSSRVRHAIRLGNVELAHALLLRTFCLHGTVIHGDKRAEWFQQNIQAGNVGNV